MKEKFIDSEFFNWYFIPSSGFVLITVIYGLISGEWQLSLIAIGMFWGLPLGIISVFFLTGIAIGIAWFIAHALMWLIVKPYRDNNKFLFF